MPAEYTKLNHAFWGRRPQLIASKAYHISGPSLDLPRIWHEVVAAFASIAYYIPVPGSILEYQVVVVLLIKVSLLCDE